jgi:hypothetical protein
MKSRTKLNRGQASKSSRTGARLRASNRHATHPAGIDGSPVSDWMAALLGRGSTRPPEFSPLND